jgi:hypothetical protein
MFNPHDDFAAVADGLETVTLLRRGNMPGATGTLVAHALRRAMTASEATIAAAGDVHKQVASGGQQTAADLTWHLSAAELADAPQLGDVIVDGAGQRWTILAVKLTTFGSRWRCTSRNVAVAFGLDDTISVLKAAYVKSACGAAEPMWRTWKTGVRARIQPQETKIVADAETHGAATRYRIFVEEELDLDQTCSIRGADGILYKIVSTSGAQRIGELQVIDAEVMR